MDLAKYTALFLEEATEHLVEMGRCLLVLEKTPDDGEAIAEVFRFAHGIKGMAASLEMDSITELAHALEDFMDRFRSRGCVDPVNGVPLLFQGLDGLERMVAVVRETGAAPPPDEALVAMFHDALARGEGEPPKKG